ncbi:ankyrin repeat and SOCS box protein 3-like isoform X2 [Physella acuta]|uniref:ankyrin repeat and SOCS box protein 3-like isoform X2 n=1 Tax=Physella acuta TaxID=109671 RepID=UPI0027DB9F0F|nr:ankyrin repeat and SOCS box protein 3-like isoform X2 [Physella acuta]
MLSHHTSEPCHTRLMKAVIDQVKDLVHEMIQAGENIEARDKHGQNVLYHALPENFTPKTLEILSLLLTAGINVNASLDGDGSSALVTSVVMGQTELVKLLIQHGADVNVDALSKFWGSLSSEPMGQYNIASNKAVTTQFIFSKGCGHSVTPLLASVMQHKPDIFKLLLQANALCECLSFGSFWRASMTSVCSTCDIKVTPLHMAAYLGDLDMTYTLINHMSLMTEYNFEENCPQSFNDITPLWFAILKGHENIVKLFLSLGKPIALPCHFGSGLQICLEEGHSAIALMILRAGYNLEDDSEWIKEGKYPSANKEVLEKIESLYGQPRPLLDWCCLSLRQKFGLHLENYLKMVQAPKKVSDILNFKDISPVSWQVELTSLVP